MNLFELLVPVFYRAYLYGASATAPIGVYCHIVDTVISGIAFVDEAV